MFLQKLPTDLFTLVVGLSILLGSTWLARRGRLLGLLCWPDALLYVLYVYAAYAIGVPFGVLFPVYVLLAALSAYTTMGLVVSIDAGAGLLLVGSMLFVGAIFALVFPALYDASPVDVGGVVFILVVGLICFVPLALFARGVVTSDGSTEAYEGAQRGSTDQ